MNTLLPWCHPKMLIGLLAELPICRKVRPHSRNHGKTEKTCSLIVQILLPRWVLSTEKSKAGAFIMWILVIEIPLRGSKIPLPVSEIPLPVSEIPLPVCGMSLTIRKPCWLVWIDLSSYRYCNTCFWSRLAGIWVQQRSMTARTCFVRTFQELLDIRESLWAPATT